MTRLLSLPLIIGIACIVIALIAMHLGWIGQGAAPMTGLPHVLMILVALGVFWSGACGLWYALGVAWFLWTTRAVMLSQQEDHAAYLLRCLWRLPLASAALCWIPLLTRASIIPGNVPRWALAIGLVITQLIVTYLWIAIMRGVLRWKHEL